MKKLLFISAVLSLAACSSDDDSTNNNCNCQKITAIYNDAIGSYEPTGAEFYSNNCNDNMQGFVNNGNGTYYTIDCTPKSN